MIQSTLVSKTIKETPRDEKSINADLLLRAGMIDKVAAGIYTYLPLGLRTLDNIKKIIREEMNALGAQEVKMPALVPAELWSATGRWDTIDVLFKLKGSGDKEYGLGSTHEEVVTPLIKKFVQSYKDLPRAVYQIQDKFRDEPRAKSGLLRGREFSMKDLYSFHASEDDLHDFYDRVTDAYHRIFRRCGLEALVTEASGGDFCKYSHEFQVPTPNGEDIIYSCASCGTHQNKELGRLAACGVCGGVRTEQKTIEVGNIFKLGTRFSSAFNATYTDRQGKEQPILMGCYGIGPSRVMGAVAEIRHDRHGLIWPQSIAPFIVHLLRLGTEDEVVKNAARWYGRLTKLGISVLFDDRDVSAGEKFADSDLIGIPYRLIISKKTHEGAELKERSSSSVRMVGLDEVRTLFHAT